MVLYLRGMKVKDLKQMLEGVDDEMEVLIPMDMNCFDGMFLHPCIEESGVADMGDDYFEDEEELEEAILLGKTENIIKSFLLVPCGFFDDDVDDFNPELN